MGEMASGRLRSTAVWEEASRFPRVKLSVDKLDEFHSDAEQLLTKTMKAYHQSNVLLNPKRWKSVRSKDNLYVYRDRVA
ncbi:TPA: hypothetical protein N0F65_004142 [Lagenidium giganteum]|uniref:Uncharacterized protein n=1 Tax=Lagenidium giganteum TaxID=4803 RepID=A0AAV2ZHP9_9STRA|nr:TPA: hypothetical protein N0F65_004142 [Lagenidium giganteum]